MRAINISVLALLLSAIFLPACTKEDPDAVVPSNGDSPKMHERTLAIRDLTGKQQATLRFRSTSRELLDQMPLEAFSFTIVAPPATVDNQPGLSSSSPAEGSANLSQTYGNRKESPPGEVDPAAKAVWVDFVSNTKAEVLSIEVKQKTSPQGRTQSLWLPGTQVFFHGSQSWRRIRIDNLSYTPLDVSFWYDSCNNGICTWRSDGSGTFSKYSGYSFKLYYGGWAWYYNCNKGVMARVIIAPNTYYHYRWTAWTRCMP
jgi:hypothetical protein